MIPHKLNNWIVYGGTLIVAVTMYMQNIPWWLVLGFSSVYFVSVRLSFPGEKKIELPEDVDRKQFNVFCKQYKKNLAAIRSIQPDILDDDLKLAVKTLCNLCDSLLAKILKDPRCIKIIPQLPDRLSRLLSIIEAHNELALEPLSLYSRGALRETTEMIEASISHFDSGHHRLLEKDALDLITDAKTFSTLLSMDH